MIDISTIKYDAELITPDGTSYPLNNALINLEWEEQASELSQRANITLRNVLIGGTRLHALAKMNCIIRIRSSWNGGDKELMFDGNIWDWNPVC